MIATDSLEVLTCDDCGRKLEMLDADCDQDGFYPIYEDCDCE